MKTKSELLEGTTNVKTSKRIANNTLKIEYNDGTTAIRLHNTNVVTFAGKKIILNSDGWRTSTTKDRINTYSPAKISQNKGLWYLDNGKLFYDNCVINAKGELISKPMKNIAIEKKVAKLKKQIARYCSLITKDNIPYPEPGDCWLCGLHDKNNVPMDGNTDNSHLFAHLKENYLHGSILVNSMRESGYNDMQIGIHYSMKLHDTFRRAVRKYLQKRLISNIAVK